MTETLSILADTLQPASPPQTASIRNEMPSVTSVPPGIVKVPVKVVQELLNVGPGLKTCVKEAPAAPSPKRRTLNTAPGCTTDPIWSKLS